MGFTLLVYIPVNLDNNIYKEEVNYQKKYQKLVTIVFSNIKTRDLNFDEVIYSCMVTAIDGQKYLI